MIKSNWGLNLELKDEYNNGAMDSFHFDQDPAHESII